MKNIIIVFSLCFFIQEAQAQSAYCNYNGANEELQIVTSKQFILVNSAADTVSVKTDLIKNGYSVESFMDANVNVKLTPYGNTTIASNYFTIAETDNNQNSLPTNSSIIYSTPHFLTQDSSLIGLSHLFYVKLKSVNDIGALERIANINNVKILGSNIFMPLWFTLSCTDESSGNALEMANIFYQSEEFEFAEPDFIVYNDLLYSNNTTSSNIPLAIRPCVNDTLFSGQWNLHNTGQYGGVAGIDINFCEARQITTGDPDVIIANIANSGIQFNHPDLPNIHTTSYDANLNTSPSSIYENEANYMAGIMGATTNNGIGIAGIAPSCPIMSINANTTETPRPNMGQAIVNAINFAVQNGASVINCPWVYDVRGYHEMIKNAINNALENGRNGKGCVMVFPTGFDSESPIDPPVFPSNLEGVIAVGGMSQCGERISRTSCDEDYIYDSIIGTGENVIESNYGTSLSVVAPGTLFPALDLVGNQGNSDDDYSFSFHNLGLASSHVSAVAALILSVNPNLTYIEVKNIIEQTAQKVRTDLYDYETTTGYTNGTWHEEMGYGLVDARAAVERATDIEDIDLHVRDYPSDNGNEPSDTNTIVWNSPDIWIETMGGLVLASNPRTNNYYKVCVRVHNDNNFASLGTEKLLLNWAKASTSLDWDNSWDGIHYVYCPDVDALLGAPIGDSCGVTIPSIPANSSKVIKVTWRVPDIADYANCYEFDENFWAFSLLARVHDGNTIPNENRNDFNMVPFVCGSNNVAWKNTLIASENSYESVVGVANPSQEPFNFVFISNPNDANENLNDFAEVYITFDRELMAAWQRGNYAGTGFRRVGDNKIQILNDTVRLNGIILYPNVHCAFKTQVNFLTQTTPRNNTFTFDIAQYSISNELIGGCHFVAIKNNDRNFRAIAEESTSVFGSEEASFTAIPIAENATYTWFNQVGDTIATGIDLTTTPDVSQTYTLEVVAAADGAKDYDSVDVLVLSGIISQISPNPATDQVTIAYQLAENIESAQIQIVNTLGIVAKTVQANDSQNSVTINVQDLTVGQYSVKLVSNLGELLDSKALVIN